MAVCYLRPTSVMQTRYLKGMKRPFGDLGEEEDGRSCKRRFVTGTLWENVVAHKMKIPHIYSSSLENFLELFEDELIQDFLWVDSCAQIADRYLLAMVYVYFRRAHLADDEYTRYNFFVALYLANDMEEDNEDDKYEIFPWALGNGWMTRYSTFLASRDRLWGKMDFRAVVSRRTCEEVIAQSPDHDVWQRHRQEHHGGAIRNYIKPPITRYGRLSPMYCKQCSQARECGTFVLPQPLPPPSPLYSFPWEPVPKLDLLDVIDHSYCHQPSGLKQSDSGGSSDSRLSHTHRMNKQISEMEQEP